jgi:hypothetical protein
MTPRSPLCTGVVLLVVSLAALGCGGSKTPAKSAEDEAPPEATPDKTQVSSKPAPGASDDTTGKGGANACSGFELDLMAALNQVACEVPDAKPDSKPNDMKDTLVVTAVADSARVSPGGRATILVTYANKKSVPLTLDFRIDPTARFSVEAYDLKTNKRADLPAAPQPKLPEGREPAEAGIARVTIAANGKATAHVGWDAQKTRWAPEKLKGTPPEMGYPRVPAGPLSKGKYVLRVVTPLTNIFEGADNEISAPKANIEVQ